MTNRTRPLSPHLTVIKPSITSVLSMGNRMSIVALSVSMLVLLYWLGALACGDEAYTQAREVFTSIPGTLLLMAITLAFFNHWCMEIAHMIWDLGYCLEIKSSKCLSVGAAMTGIVLSVLFWLVIVIF